MKMLEEYYSEWSSIWTKQGWLDYLLNTYGEFKVAAAKLLPDGTPIWSKHLPYLALQHLEDAGMLDRLDSKYPHISKAQFLSEVNNRTILRPEIVLDLEKPEQMPTITNFLQRHTVPYELWATGSRGFHIHFIEPELALDSKEEAAALKATFIQAVKADLMKKSEGAMIALENTPHWKTGKVKHLIGSN